MSPLTTPLRFLRNLSISDFSDSASISSLPSYHSRIPRQNRASRTPTEHAFHLGKGGKAPWATLLVLSDAPSPKHHPIWIQGDPIDGCVLLSCDQQDSVQSIVITVRGQIVTGAGDYETTPFLEHVTTIWEQGATKPTGQLKLPFSIAVPDSIEAKGVTYTLPQSFKESISKATVIYTLSATFSRKKFRLNDEVATTIIHIPVTRPPQPSQASLIAYEQNMPLPGPSEDKDGWQALPSVVFTGMLFESRPVQATCTLLLANPLCYTRGTFIPCSIRIECTDDQALDVLASSAAIHLLLQRHIHYGSATNFKKRVGEIRDMTRCVWWPTEKTEPGVRELRGEMDLPKSLQPTTAILHLSVNYYVTLMPFDTPGFIPNQKSTPLLTSEVEVATRLTKGLRVQPYSSSPVGHTALSESVSRTNGLKDLHRGRVHMLW